MGIDSRPVYKFSYDFSTQGGRVGIIPLAGLNIPMYSIVYGGVLDIITGFTSGGSPYLSLKINKHNDLLSQLIYSNAIWANTGLKAIIPVMTAATAVKLTNVNDRPCLRIDGGDVDGNTVTAGKFNLFLIIIPPSSPPQDL